MALMGKKMKAAQALEGKFSAEGLASMAGEEGSAEMALAKSLADRIDEGDVESAASVESSIAVSANNLLTVTSPSSVTGATGYNVYVASYSGGEIKQNTTAIAIGTNWTEPTSGLVTGTAAPPNSGVGDGNLTQSVQYPGGTTAVRVANDYYVPLPEFPVTLAA